MSAPPVMNDTPQSSPQKPAASQKILIQVFDENRATSKEFYCLKHHLRKYMHYFEPYIGDATAIDDIDISVHCDIKIFEWLLRYMEYREWALQQKQR